MRLAFLQEGTRQNTHGLGLVPIVELFMDEVFVTARQTPDLRVVVISSKYGVVDGTTGVYPYTRGLTFERVDQWQKAYNKQWKAKAAGWFEGVDDLFVGASGAYLYVLQRLLLPIDWAPKMARYVVGNVATAAQFGRWATTHIEVENGPQYV